MKGFVYIIQSIKLKIYYIGSSTNPEHRLKEHNTGRVKATKDKGPWILRFTQAYPTIKESRQIEYKLKKLKRRDYIEKIIRDGYIRLK